MLAIRLQRTGRKGLAQYRVIVQDSHRAPTSGKIVAQVGHYNPHTKEIQLKKDRVEFYLTNGAQPSDRVARLLKTEGFKLPKWVSVAEPKERTTRNPEKLRKNQPEEAAPAQTPSEEPVAEEEKPAAPEAEAPTEEPAAEGTTEATEEKPASDA